ncbi:MAG: CDP-alcohol phosphatidyltransferase family protein [Promethearchaeota archaeon]|jgi:phosphatidylglycerophosphate synthase
MLSKINQHKSVHLSSINTIGIIFLPNDPFLIKKQPFYLKKLCGLSIIERNIRIFIKNGIRDIYILANSKEDLNIGELDKISHIKKIRSLDLIKDSLNQEKNSIKEIEYGIILDGGILFDDRIISSLLNSEEDIIYIKGKNIETNCNIDQLKNLACKIKINGINLYPQANSSFSFEDFINSSSFNKSSYHSTDEITTYKSDMRRNVPISVYVFQHSNDFKSVKKLLVKKTQKGTLDFIAWYFNRYFENFFVYVLADSKITANHVTIFVNIFGFFVLFLFLVHYWWIGLILLILINILDGVDGKLARLRMKESKVGHIEHSFDQLYEQAIYVGIGFGAYFIIDSINVIIVLILMLLMDSFNRHCSMQYKEVMGITLADSSRFDQIFRKFDGRRNIYTVHILIFGILGHFEYTIFSICVHAIITSIIYSIQAIRHMKKVDDIKF